MTKLNFTQEFHKYAKQLPFKSPPVPVGHPLIGSIGECIPGREFRLKGMSQRTFDALMKDEERVRNKIAWFLREAGQITTWDGILAARAGGRADDRLYYKLSQSISSNNWSCFFRSGGVPGAGAYTAIPGGAAHNVNSAGAMSLINPVAPRRKYLLNFGVQHPTGTNIVLLTDLLVAAGNINANAIGDQTVNTTALTRYTDGVGVMMILEVTTNLGSTASNVTVTYTNQAGTAGRSSGAIAMTVNALTFRLQPIQGGAIMPLQADDFGVRSVQTVSFSAAMGAGVVALLLYRPLLLIPTLATTTYVERNTPAMLSGIIELVTDAGGLLGCLMPLVLTSTTSTGTQTYFLQTCDG